MTGIGKLLIGLTALVYSIALSSVPAMAESAPPAPVAAPEVYKVMAENDQFRVLKATWQPGQEDKFHSHPADRVSLFETDCKLRLTKPDGTHRDVSLKHGKAVARTGKPVMAHKAKNIGDKVCVIWIVEVKK